MPFISAIGADAKVPHVMAYFSKLGSRSGRPLIDLHEALLRAESPFSVAERELMAAFVSGVNACEYCYGAHAAAAGAFGVSEDLIRHLVADIDSAEVDDRLKPVFRFLKKLSLAPTRIVQADADAVFAAGWDERAFYDLVLVGCLYNFMNRIVEGSGIKSNPLEADQAELDARMARMGGASTDPHRGERSYTKLAKMWGIEDAA